MNREAINRAASLVGGKCVILTYVYDDALAGYTIQGNDVVAIYDYDKILEITISWDYLDNSQTPEDWLLDDIRKTRQEVGMEPIIMRTNTKVEDTL